MPDLVQFLFTIDAEPDERLLEPGRPALWRGQDYLIEHLGEIRKALSKCTGRPAHFSWHWRTDPQIEICHGDACWPLRAYGREITLTERAGDEHGTHPHTFRWDAAQRSWVNDYADQSWIEYCVRVSFDAFERVFARPCRSFRFGDCWIDNETLDLVESLGAHFDLTLEPNHLATSRGPPWELFLGDSPDTRGVPTTPYRRSRRDFRRADRDGASRLWMVPVSTAVLIFGRDGITVEGVPPAHAAERLRRREKLMGVAQKAVQLSRLGPLMGRSIWAKGAVARCGRLCFDALTITARAETTSLNLVRDPAKYACAFDDALARSGDQYVHTVVRSGDLADRRNRARFSMNLNFVTNHPLARRFMVSTPSHFVTSWDAGVPPAQSDQP